MNNQYRFNAEQVQDALAVVGQGMASDYGIRVDWNSGKRVCADLQNKIVHVPRLACVSQLGIRGNSDFDTALSLIRQLSAHEFGHCAKTKLTPANTPKGAKFTILNALEDVRMERSVAVDYPGYGQIFQWANQHHNKRIACDALDGKPVQPLQPLWEALVAAMFQVQGVAPAWTLTPTAQKYFDAIYSEFSNVLTAKNTKDCLEITDRIFNLLKKMLKDDQQKQQQPKPQPKQKQQKQQPKPQPKQQEDDKDESDEDGKDGEQGEGQDGEEGDESEDGEADKDGKPGKNDESDEEGKDGEGESDDADGEGDEDGDEDAAGSDGEGDEDGDDKDGEGEGSDSDDEDADGDKQGNGKGKGKKDDEDGEQAEGEGDEDGEGDEADEDGKPGKNSNGEADPDADADEDSEADGQKAMDNKCKEPGKRTDQQGDDRADEGGDEDEAGKGEFTPETDAEMEARLAREAEGQDLNERANDEIAKALKDVEQSGQQLYTSRRDVDEHRTPNGGEIEKQQFAKVCDKMQNEVAAMTMALEQALRALTRCRKDQFMRSGRLDNSRMVEIAKNLSKEIFYQTRKGKELSTAVAIIIDQSGSMGCYAEIRDLTILLGECLSRLDIPFEVIGTTTKYECGDRGLPARDGFTRTNPIVYDHFKNFEEQWMVVRQRMMHLGSFKHNIDGEAVEYAAKRVSMRPETRKIVFSLCDGCPCGGQHNDSDLGQNIVNVSKNARKAGIEIYGVGIGTEAPASYYGAENFIELNDGEGKGQQFVTAFAKILTNGQVKV
jgi:cobalamin biosynthesis protein CobT